MTCFVLDIYDAYSGSYSTHDSETHNESPETSPGVSLGRSPDTLLVLLVLAIEGIVHQFTITQDFSTRNLIVLDLNRSLLFFFFNGRHN